MQTQTERIPAELVRAFHQARARTRRIFEIAAPEAYHLRPIPLRHPIVFYEGHLDAFNYNTLLKAVLGEPSLNPEFDQLFARGIDPETEALASSQSIASWPPREAIHAYGEAINERLLRAIASQDLTGGPPELRGGALFYLLLEHELMHQETLLYLMHQLPHGLKRRPQGLAEPDWGPAPAPERVAIPPGPARLGARPGEFPFSWDNERESLTVAVPAFAIDAYNVTNGEFLAFVEEGGYERRSWWDDEAWTWKELQGIRHPAFWRDSPAGWRLHDLFEDRPLPLSWPVLVTHAEARAYARSRGLALPSEAEWHRAAFGDELDQPYPWGDAPPSARHGNFDFQLWSATRVGSYPDGASASGVFDLVGNGWEWTSTPFGPFPGFRADPSYPVYSQDFFDGKHFVMKGGSWFTDARLLRRSFRNWFFWHYPFMYATFRCVER